MKIKKLIALMLAVSMTLVALTGCGNSNVNSGTTQLTMHQLKKKDIVLAKEADATTIDPQMGWDGNSLVVLRQMYNQLLNLTIIWNLRADLAESWSIYQILKFSLS